MSKIALTPNASGNGVFTISAPNSGTNRAIALPDAAGTIPLLAAASNTAITATPAELNILDGVTSTAAELNILDGVTSTAAELNILDGVTSTAAELNILDGVTSTAAELNILDGVTSTAAEINLIDGGTARGTTAVADGDGFLTNDGGTMRMTKVETLATYMGTKITGGSMVFIRSSGAISNVASVVFDDDDFDATKFDHYVFMFQHVKPVTDGSQVMGQTSTDGGSNFATTNGDYHSPPNSDQVAMLVSDGVGNASSDAGVSGRVELYAPHVALPTYSYSSLVYMQDNANIKPHIASQAANIRLAAEDVDGFRFIFNSGNVASGEIVMYGIANA